MFIGSYLMQIGAINPATGKVYSVFDVIVVTQATGMAAMTVGALLSIGPSIVRGLIAG